MLFRIWSATAEIHACVLMLRRNARRMHTLHELYPLVRESRKFSEHSMKWVKYEAEASPTSFRIRFPLHHSEKAYPCEDQIHGVVVVRPSYALCH